MLFSSEIHEILSKDMIFKVEWEREDVVYNWGSPKEFENMRIENFGKQFLKSKEKDQAHQLFCKLCLVSIGQGGIYSEYNTVGWK